VWYSHGTHLRAFTVPNWTQDKAQGDPGQELDTYDFFKNANLPQPSDWYAGGDPPHLITPVFHANDLSEDKTWVGVAVHYDQVNLQYPVLFDMWIRWFDGQDWVAMEPVDPSTAAADWGGGTKQFKIIPDPNAPTVEPLSPWCQLAIRFDTMTYDANEAAGNVNNIKVAGIDLFYDAHPDEVIQYELAIVGADYAELHYGARDTRTAKEIARELKDLLKVKRDLTYIDVFNDSHTVRVAGVTDQAYRHWKEAPNYARGFRVETVIGVNLIDVEWPV
jgi:hypothetical protein